MFGFSPFSNFIVDSNIVETKVINRTMKERLWSWPWRPWVKTKIILLPAIYYDSKNDNIYIHPKLLEEIKISMNWSK